MTGQNTHNRRQLLRAAQAFSAAVPFNNAVTAFEPLAVSGGVNFTVAAGAAYPGARAIYRLIANGTNLPTFAGFKEASDSPGYDNRNTIVNTIQFEFDGVDYWYKVTQQKGALPTMVPIALTFPNRAGPTISQSGQVYSSTVTTGNFDAIMSSAQAIPQNRAGRITVRSNGTLIALCNTNVAESYTVGNYEYYLWQSPPNAWTGTGATANIQNSGVPTAYNDFLRLERSNSGVVSAYVANNVNGPWTLVRTFGATSLEPLYVTCGLSGAITQSNGVEIVSFEVEP
jgi:hypothetical protein